MAVEAILSGSRAGGLKAAATNKAKDPNFYRRIGQIGGRNGNRGGFAKAPWESDEEHRARVRAAGALGGSVSRRKPRNHKQENQ